METLVSSKNGESNGYGSDEWMTNKLMRIVEENKDVLAMIKVRQWVDELAMIQVNMCEHMYATMVPFGRLELKFGTC